MSLPPAPENWDWLWIDTSDGDVQYLTDDDFRGDMALPAELSTAQLVHTRFLHIEENLLGEISIYIHRSLIEEKT